MYTKKLYVGWADVDFNAHMRNTAYLDKAADVRQMFLTEHGFPIEEFARLRIGPVVMKDEAEYFKEVRLIEEITVTCALAGHAPDGSRYLLRHDFFKRDGTLSAIITSAGGWLDLAERKVIAPPPSLLSVVNLLEKTNDFVSLPSSVSARRAAPALCTCVGLIFGRQAGHLNVWSQTFNTGSLWVRFFGRDAPFKRCL